jgi:hypothetical protein
MHAAILPPPVIPSEARNLAFGDYVYERRINDLGACVRSLVVYGLGMTAVENGESN